MPFDPSLPANNAPVLAAELRGQFTGLKGLVDALENQCAALQTQCDSLQTTVVNLQAELALVPPGPAVIVDAYSPGPGALHIEISATRASQISVWYKGPGDTDFTQDVVPGLIWEGTGLLSGTNTIKAAGVNNGGVGPACDPIDYFVS